MASIWPFGDNTGGQTEVKIKQVVTSVHETTRLWRKPHPKVQLFQRKEGGMLYWPACWGAYKRKSWRAWSSVCSQGSTPPHPSWTQPELHHLDTGIRKFPTMPLSFGRALINRGAPFPIYQANLGATQLPGTRPPPSTASPRHTPFPEERNWTRTHTLQ